jgi:hypothetical protein
MDFTTILWSVIAALAVLGGWLSYRAARRTGKGSLAGCLIGFLVALVVIVLLSLIATLLLPL